jgi:polyphosphate kinase
VRSIIDRFLEHARIYRFENDGSPEIFLSSADWMPRNLNTRIEIAFPLLSRAVKEEVDAILNLQLCDTAKARMLNADGTSLRASDGRMRARVEQYRRCAFLRKGDV